MIQIIICENDDNDGQPLDALKLQTLDFVCTYR